MADEMSASLDGLKRSGQRMLARLTEASGRIRRGEQLSRDDTLFVLDLAKEALRASLKLIYGEPSSAGPLSSTF